MATVSGVALVTICIFIVIQLFHFVQQRRDDYAQQLENIAHSVRQPLAEAVLRMDVPEAKKVLNTLLPVGILSRADIVLPNEFQALHANFPPERPVPTLIARLFELPIQISVPLYSLERVPANQQPLAYLVLQADSFRMYQFILSILSTMLSTYLLLALILVKVLAPGFYARQDIRTPVRIALITLAATQLMNLAFIWWLRHAGLALSISLAAWINAGLLFWKLRQGGIYEPRPGWGRFLVKVFAALTTMAAVLVWAMGGAESWLHAATLERALRLGWVVAVGAVSYLAVLWLLGFRLSDFSKRTRAD